VLSITGFPAFHSKLPKPLHPVYPYQAQQASPAETLAQAGFPLQSGLERKLVALNF